MSHESSVPPDDPAATHGSGSASPAPSFAGAARVWSGVLPSRWSARGMGHATAHLVLTVSGVVEQTDGRRPVTLDASVIRCSPPGDRSDLRTGAQRATCLVIEAPLSCTVFPGARHFLRATDLAGRMQSLYHAASDPDSCAFAVELDTLELFAALAGRTDARREYAIPPWVRQLRDLLHDRYRVPPSLHDLATLSDRHPVHVARAFRVRYGVSVGEYRRRLQLRAAFERVRNGDEALSSIAYDAGFADQSHMTRLFRRHLGVTPAQIRRREATGSTNS